MHESRQLWRQWVNATNVNSFHAHVVIDGHLQPFKFAEKQSVLDHGLVVLASQGPQDGDLQISHAARALMPWSENWRGADDIKLLEYMLRHKHSTPFEHLHFSFFIRAPIMVYRQWHRHRTQSYNEMSARYRPLPDLSYVPDPTMIGKQSKKNHQSRILDEDPSNDHYMMARMIRDEMNHDYNLYEHLLEMGMPRELARGVLSVFMYSDMYASANLLNWLKFITLRDDEHAQYEIQVYAKTIRDILYNYVPVTMWLFERIREEGADKERIYDLYKAGKLEPIPEPKAT